MTYHIIILKDMSLVQKVYATFLNLKLTGETRYKHLQTCYKLIDIKTNATKTLNLQFLLMSINKKHKLQREMFNKI